ncbi:MAG: DUF305 domain-containing protein, partial [Neisseria sp.]|nr:DUF305 domain-containing protein [Neisseria sp.]
ISGSFPYFNSTSAIFTAPIWCGNIPAQYKDPDVAFAAGMLPHHIGAVKMAEVELKYGKDPEMRKLAEDIINTQQAEIEQMQKWLKAHNKKK